MKLVANLSSDELKRIKILIGEAFVTNELFHEFGDMEERRNIVMRYMDYYVDFVYHSKNLYQNEEGNAFIGFCHSEEKHTWLQLKMLGKMLVHIPFGKIKGMLRQIKENTGNNAVYANKPHVDILLVCIEKKAQKKGYAKELVQYAKDYALKKNCPLLFDTDMKEYAEIYQHFGCELYNQKTASNGVTRYNLVWNK